ncbi:MAG: hypothetical protein KAG34_12680 [Cocleimonas sp.]|nr:hypothetical protein [Cocleimonas sp.]
MAELLVSLGVFTLLFAVSALFLFLLNYLFPSTKNLLPSGWVQWMSFRFVSYYFLAAVVLIYLGMA